ncbi:MAG: fused MFS/spermidine synthase, partial [Planctomycetes bacterium]|nr:fused MFS/spermidine synthase [Planctomycetota bacterium]
CGMSLELAGVRVLAPILGASLYTWTGIIGVMLAGTASGNYLGGILADHGVGPAVRRFALLIVILIGAAAAPVVARELFTNFNPDQVEAIELLTRLAGAILGGLVVVPGLWLAKRRSGRWIITALVGGSLGTVLAHTAGRAIDKAFSLQAFTDFHEKLTQQFGFDVGPWLIHGLGLLAGVTIALLFIWDAPKKDERVTRSGALSGTFFLAAMTTLAILLLTGIYSQYDFMLHARDVVQKVLGWTFGLFFLPMLLLGAISPQVIRLSVSDVKHAGRVAGSIYAWSTTGAIIGTFATGYFLISSFGTFRVLMVLAFVLLSIGFLVGRLWKNNAMLYAASIIVGGAIFGLFVIDYGSNRYDRETKYYAIKVTYKEIEGKRRVKLALDHLTHSIVDLDDPTWLGYPHEYVQGELLEMARAGNKDTRLLVIGGGGYTFPRYAEFAMPDVLIDVVEIDPGVTDIAFEKLALRRDTAIRSHHMDGRQFVSERAGKGQYRLVMQDAVNDLSVPYHLMTKEYNDAVKQTLTPDGAYLLTLIDSIRDGKLWRAAVHTMRQTFKYVYLVSPETFHDRGAIRADRQVYIIYGSDQPLDVNAVRNAQQNAVQMIANAIALAAPIIPVNDKNSSPWWREPYITVLDDATLEQLVNQGKKLILTDQYCPVDNLMSEVFRDRERNQR